MKIKTVLANELHGSINNGFLNDLPTCRTRADGTIILMKKPIPSYGRTSAQDTQRINYKNACNSWTQRESQEKEQWNKDAKPFRMTGFNLFIRTYLISDIPKKWANFYGTRTFNPSVKLDDYEGQTFKASPSGPTESFVLKYIKLPIYRGLTPGKFQIDLTAVDGAHKPTGPILSTGYLNGNALETSQPSLFVKILMTEVTLLTTTEYAFYCSAPDGDATNDVHLCGRNYTNLYPDGGRVFSPDGGSYWGYSTVQDFFFEIWGRKVA